MRKNENPMEVFQQVRSAIVYAKKTTELIKTVGALTDDDVKHVLIHVFIYNNGTRNDNDGGINKIVNRKAQKEQQAHDVDAWLAGISELVKQVQSEYFAKKDDFYPLISLPLREGTITPNQKTQTSTGNSSTSNAGGRGRKHKNRFQNDYTPYNSSYNQSPRNP